MASHSIHYYWLSESAISMNIITLVSSLKLFFKKSFQFKGYSSRAEAWWAVAFIFGSHLAIAAIAAALVGGLFRDDVLTTTTSQDGSTQTLLFTGPSGFIVGIALVLQILVFITTIVPALALSWRRLHDAGLPGPLFFLWFIPLLGWFILVIFYLLPSRPDKRRLEWDPTR